MTDEAIPYYQHDMFGFTNDAKVILAVQQYRDAMVADGWSIKATYSPTEEIDRASTLERDGFKSLILTRDNSDKKMRWKYEAKISIWGPDRLSITPPPIYSFEVLEASQRKCAKCGAKDVQTYRVGFAVRVCEACLPAARAAIETPGWTS